MKAGSEFEGLLKAPPNPFPFQHVGFKLTGLTLKEQKILFDWSGAVNSRCFSLLAVRLRNSIQQQDTNLHCRRDHTFELCSHLLEDVIDLHERCDSCRHSTLRQKPLITVFLYIRHSNMSFPPCPDTCLVGFSLFSPYPAADPLEVGRAKFLS